MRTIPKIPFFECHVRAGFPSPAADYVEHMLDLNEYLIAHPNATFFVRVEGRSMVGAGIFPNDLLIVDRAAQVEQGDVAVCLLDGEYTVKRMFRYPDKIMLQAENNDYPPITVSEENDFEVWGKVIYVVHAP